MPSRPMLSSQDQEELRASGECLYTRDDTAISDVGNPSQIINTIESRERSSAIGRDGVYLARASLLQHLTRIYTLPEHVR